MHGYYPQPVMQMYPPSRSHSMAKLNKMPHDYNIYEKVKVGGEYRRPYRPIGQLTRQQSYDEGAIQRMMQQQQHNARRPDRFSRDLSGENEDSFFDRMMDHNQSRHINGAREGRNTMPSKNKEGGKKNKENKENKKMGMNISSLAMALIGSLSSKSEDSIYESVEQIQYRKTLELMNRREKVRDIHRTGHPLFDHLREERALATSDTNRRKPSAVNSRKTSNTNSPTYSPNTSGDEQEGATLRRSNGRIYQSREEILQRNARRHSHVSPSYNRTGSAGSESDDEWAIPRPKIGGRKSERVSSLDESDSSKYSPIR